MRQVGERSRKNQGYVFVFIGMDSPMANERGECFEHRLVMAEKIGRPLLPHENVHHVNGVKDDNRIANLELWVKSQPTGQRAQDLVAWAKELLATYEPIVDRLS